MNIETDSKSKGMTTGGVITKININASSSRMGKKFKKNGCNFRRHFTNRQALETWPNSTATKTPWCEKTSLILFFLFVPCQPAVRSGGVPSGQKSVLGQASGLCASEHKKDLTRLLNSHILLSIRYTRTDLVYSLSSVSSFNFDFSLLPRRYRPGRTFHRTSFHKIKESKIWADG